MKNVFVLLLLLVSINAMAQVRGSGNVITRSYPLEDLTTLKVDLYAEVTVDMEAEPGLTITADDNLLSLINLEVEDGELILKQMEWIKSKNPIEIMIGAPGLERIENDVHVTTTVKNISSSSFRAMALLGKIILQGTTEKAYLAAESGIINARELQAEVADLNLWDAGEIRLGSPNRIEGIVKKEGRVIYDDGATKVATSGSGSVLSATEAQQVKRPDARFIQFKIKNNSGRRIQCHVTGPKPDGSRFGYGFPLNPGQVRKKDWSVGSKVFLVTKLGTRKLLRKITAADEGEVVDLFSKK